MLPAEEDLNSGAAGCSPLVFWFYEVPENFLYLLRWT